MPGMGLETAYGNASMADELRQRIKDQIEAEQRAQALAQQQFTNNRLTANDARQAQEHSANMLMMADQHGAQQQQMKENEAAKGVAGLSVNQSIPPAVMGRIRGTMQEANATENPPLAQPPNMPGMMQPDVIPGQQPGAVWKGNDAQRSAQEDKQKMTDLLNDPSTTPQVKQFLKMRGIMPKGENIPYQLITEPDGPMKAPRQPVQVGPQGIFTDPADAIGQPGYHAPQQPIVVQMPTGPGLLNRGTGVATPVKDASGKDVGVRPSAQETEHTRTNKDALDTLSQLDQAIENAKDLIGPGQGRISSLEQMAGSADPRIQALNVKMKAAKMRVDHAITGSVRAGASPTLLAQWDNILANKVDPAGLKSGVQAMREILGGGAGAPSGGSGIKSITEIK